MNAHSHMNRSPSRLMWIDEIPKDWDQIRGKRVFRQVRTPKKPDDEQLSATQKYGVVPQNRFMEQEGSRVVLALSGIDNFRHVDKDDFVISLRSFQGGIERCHYDGCVSPAYTILKKNREISEDFFGYLLKCDWFVAALQVGVTGIREGKNVSYEEFGDIILPFPTVQEQTAIARFLDHETGLIDGLIEKKTRFIALLKEKRAAVITHAVTKGIDPDAPMKDSDNAWLRHIPAHWVSVPIKHHVQLQSGFAFKAEAFGDTGTPLVRMSNLKRGELDLSDAVRIPAGEENPEFLLRTGDILLGMSGSIGETGSLGNFSVVQEKDLPCLLNQRVGRFVFVSERVVPDYFKLILQSKSFLEPVFLTSTSTAQFNISPSQIGNVFMALPDVEEQIAVVDVVHAATLKIDSLIALTERSIDLLREKRAALITAAVTGKIDVRLAA